MSAGEWPAYLSGLVPHGGALGKPSSTLEDSLKRRFSRHEVILLPSARLGFYLLLKKSFKPGDEIIFSSGKIETNTSLLDREEESLLLFTSFFLNALGDTTMSITDTYDIINETLPALGTRYHLYEVELPEGITGEIDLEIRMRFRALTPLLLAGSHDELLENQPIFDMASISAQIQIVRD